MKHISTFLSILSLILVGILYYLHFSAKEKPVKTTVVSNNNKSQVDFRIAYFDIDSLQAHYEYFKYASNQMKSKEDAMNNELGSLKNSFQRKIREWEQKGTSMTQSEGEAAQREYAQMEQTYQQRRMSLEQQLEKQKVDLMTDLRKKVELFLKEYNKQKGYAYIFSYEPGFMMYYKDSIYDITPDLITGLNNEYKGKEKKNK